MGPFDDKRSRLMASTPLWTRIVRLAELRVNAESDAESDRQDRLPARELYLPRERIIRS